MTARVLVVDDVLPNVKLLEARLSSEYFHVVTAYSGQEALDKAFANPPDIVLLDVMMPQMDGFEACRRLKADPRTCHVPVIMVTALSASEDRVRGLEAGADDYVTKPVVPKELAARIRAALRRVQLHETSSAPPRSKFGDVELRREQGIALKNGQELNLTKTEFRLLCDLAQHANRVISRELLLQRVWGYEFPGDGRLVDSHIRRLRTKVELDPANPALIQTIRGFGYKFVC